MIAEKKIHCVYFCLDFFFLFYLFNANHDKRWTEKKNPKMKSLKPKSFGQQNGKEMNEWEWTSEQKSKTWTSTVLTIFFCCCFVSFSFHFIDVSLALKLFWKNAVCSCKSFICFTLQFISFSSVFLFLVFQLLSNFYRHKINLS